MPNNIVDIAQIVGGLALLVFSIWLTQRGRGWKAIISLTSLLLLFFVAIIASISIFSSSKVLGVLLLLGAVIIFPFLLFLFYQKEAARQIGAELRKRGIKTKRMLRGIAKTK